MPYTAGQQTIDSGMLGDIFSYLTTPTTSGYQPQMYNAGGWSFAGAYNDQPISGEAGPNGPPPSLAQIGALDGPWYAGQKTYYYDPKTGQKTGEHINEQPGSSWIEKYGPYIPLMFVGGALAAAGAAGGAAGAAGGAAGEVGAGGVGADAMAGAGSLGADPFEVIAANNAASTGVMTPGAAFQGLENFGYGGITPPPQNPFYEGGGGAGAGGTPPNPFAGGGGGGGGLFGNQGGFFNNLLSNLPGQSGDGSFGGMLKSVMSGGGGSALKLGQPLMQILSGIQGNRQAKSLQDQMKLPNPNDIVGMPGYQAGLEAVRRGMGPGGYVGSGNEMAALQKYGGSFYNDYVAQRLASARAQAGPVYGGISSNALIGNGLMQLGGML